MLRNVTTILAALVIAVAPSVPAQSSRSQFDVASVKPSNSGRPGMSIETEPGRFKAINATVSFLIQYAYGLKDFQGPPADPNNPSIFTALQEQLGLQLESARGPVEVLVIDSVSKPSEN